MKLSCSEKIGLESQSSGSPEEGKPVVGVALFLLILPIMIIVLLVWVVHDLPYFINQINRMITRKRLSMQGRGELYRYHLPETRLVIEDRWTIHSGQWVQVVAPSEPSDTVLAQNAIPSIKC